MPYKIVEYTFSNLKDLFSEVAQAPEDLISKKQHLICFENYFEHIGVKTILVEENIEFELDTLDNYVKVAYPDLRKCINMVQQNVSGTKLSSPTKGDEGEADWKFEMVQLFKEGKIMIDKIKSEFKLNVKEANWLMNEQI